MRRAHPFPETVVECAGAVIVCGCPISLNMTVAPGATVTSRAVAGPDFTIERIFAGLRRIFSPAPELLPPGLGQVQARSVPVSLSWILCTTPLAEDAHEGALNRSSAILARRAAPSG